MNRSCYKKVHQNNRGDSLVGILIAVGLLSVFTISALSVAANHARALKRTYAKDSKMEFRAQVYSFLSAFRTCGESLRAQNGTSPFRLDLAALPARILYFRLGDGGEQIFPAPQPRNQEPLVYPRMTSLTITDATSDGMISIDDGAGEFPVQKVIARIGMTIEYKDVDNNVQEQKDAWNLPLYLDASSDVVGCGATTELAFPYNDEDAISEGECVSGATDRATNPMYVYGFDAATGKLYCRGFQPQCPGGFFLTGIGSNGEGLCEVWDPSIYVSSTSTTTLAPGATTTTLPGATTSTTTTTTRPPRMTPVLVSVTCESQGGRPATCAVTFPNYDNNDVVNNFTMANRLSNAGCTYGSSFGLQDRNGARCANGQWSTCASPVTIWVDRGCRAVFSVNLTLVQ